MKSIACHLLASALLLPTICSADPMQILGLPLGGKLPSKPKVCPLDTTRVKAICWIGAPFQFKGSFSGFAHLPDPDSRVKWAAYASFSLVLTKDLVLDEIRVQPLPPHGQSDISTSLRSRFGLPTDTSKQSAVWNLADIYIKLLCASELECLVTIRSPSARAALQREIDERNKVDLKRPPSL